MRRFTSIKILDYNLFTADVKRHGIAARTLRDLKQIATQGQLDIQKLKLVKCRNNICAILDAHRLLVRFELEDDHDAAPQNAPSVVTQDAKRRLITKLRCRNCSRVMSE